MSGWYFREWSIQVVTQLKIQVSGMRCTRCLEAVETALRALGGLQECTVRVGNIELSIDESELSPAGVFSAIREAGNFDIAGFRVSE